MDAVAAFGPGRVISGQGTPEPAWQAWPPLHSLPVLPLSTFGNSGGRIVIVAPHPDDEVLAFGGLLALLALQGWGGPRALVIGVTDGDASHPGSVAWPAAALGRRRREESAEGLRRIGWPSPDRAFLGIPDGRVQAHTTIVTARLRDLLRPTDTVLSPWRFDGHPDHDATARATAAACRAVQCPHAEAPVWMWHWARPGDRRVPWSRLRRLLLSPQAQQAKACAIAAHATQLEAQDTGAPPVLAPWALDRLQRDAEYLFVPTSWR
jgi:LmbE family N-acetylglucosaminyl deacetylase